MPLSTSANTSGFICIRVVSCAVCGADITSVINLFSDFEGERRKSNPHRGVPHLGHNQVRLANSRLAHSTCTKSRTWIYWLSANCTSHCAMQANEEMSLIELRHFGFPQLRVVIQAFSAYLCPHQGVCQRCERTG